jgi:predicted nucleotidyltransferase
MAVECDRASVKQKQHWAGSKRLGLEHVYLFGSAARGEAREGAARQAL